MNRNQRLILLALAAVVVIAALIVLPGGDDEETPTPAQTTTTRQQSRSTPQSATTTSSTSAPAPKPPLLQAGKETELSFEKGDTVRFRVRADAAEELHVHGYDIKRDLQPGKTITVSFPADIEGIFEIELEHSGTKLATLKVEPN